MLIAHAQIRVTYRLYYKVSDHNPFRQMLVVAGIKKRTKQYNRNYWYIYNKIFINIHLWLRGKTLAGICQSSLQYAIRASYWLAKHCGTPLWVTPNIKYRIIKYVNTRNLHAFSKTYAFIMEIWTRSVYFRCSNIVASINVY